MLRQRRKTGGKAVVLESIIGTSPETPGECELDMTGVFDDEVSSTNSETSTNTKDSCRTVHDNYEALSEKGSALNVKCIFCHPSSLDRKRIEEGKMFWCKNKFFTAVKCLNCNRYSCWDCIDAILQTIPRNLQSIDNWCNTYSKLNRYHRDQLTEAPFCSACEYRTDKKCKIKTKVMSNNFIFLKFILWLLIFIVKYFQTFYRRKQRMVFPTLKILVFIVAHYIFMSLNLYHYLRQLE